MTAKKKTRALVLSGGGSKGAYQVGVLQHWLQDLKIQYDYVCGISVGALNGGIMAQTRVDDPEGAYALMDRIWLDVTNDRVRKKWYRGLLGMHIPAIWKPSFYDSSALEGWVRGALDMELVRRSDRRLFVGAVSWNTGEYRIATDEEDNLSEWILASASFPLFFEPVRIGDELWTDGGVRNVTPIAESVKQGADVIDIIMVAGDGQMGYFDAKMGSIVPYIPRTIEMMNNEVIRNDIKVIGLKNDLAVIDPRYRHIEVNLIQPSEGLGVDSLDFDQEGVKRMRLVGYRDALAHGLKP